MDAPHRQPRWLPIAAACLLVACLSSAGGLADPGADNVGEEFRAERDFATPVPGAFGFQEKSQVLARRILSQTFTAPAPPLQNIKELVEAKLTEKGAVQILEPDSLILTDDKANTDYLKAIIEQLGFRTTKSVPAPGGLVTLMFAYSMMSDAEVLAKAVLTEYGKVQVVPPDKLLVSDSADNMEYIQRVLTGLGFQAGQTVTQAELVTTMYVARHVPVAELKKLADSLKSPRGKVDLFPPNALVVTDTPGSIRYMSDVIAGVDKRPTLIMIEARTYETFRDITSDYGIDVLWRAKSSEHPTPYLDLSLMARPPIPEDNAFSAAAVPARHDIGGYQVGTRIGVIRGTGAGLDMGDIKVMLDFLVSQGHADILTNPKIVVADGETASISTGEKIPYRAFKIVGGVEVFVTEYELAEIKLEVTPHVNEGGYITMDVSPKADTVSGFRGADQVPVITKREASTRVAIPSGSTLVIGGLTKSETREVIRKIPGVWRVPFLGKLFQAKDYEKSDTNLYVSITPYILPYGYEEPTQGLAQTYSPEEPGTGTKE